MICQIPESRLRSMMPPWHPFWRDYDGETTFEGRPCRVLGLEVIEFTYKGRLFVISANSL